MGPHVRIIDTQNPVYPLYLLAKPRLSFSSSLLHTHILLLITTSRELGEKLHTSYTLTPRFTSFGVLANT